MFPSLRPTKLAKNRPKSGSSNHRIARELTEYVVLHLLSIHLTDYFNLLEKDSSDGIVKYRREDLSAIVLGNRILDLISKQPEDRPALGRREDEPEGHELVMMWKDGLIHSKFELTLPQGSNVHRTTSNEISIEHSRFKMKIAVSGGESSGVPPQHFDELYLNRKFVDVDYRIINVAIKGALTWSGMLGVGNWNYFAWIDSFLKTLKGHIDFEQFIMQIGYQQSLTAHLLDRSRNANRKVGISKSKG